MCAFFGVRVCQEFYDLQLQAQIRGRKAAGICAHLFSLTPLYQPLWMDVLCVIMSFVEYAKLRACIEMVFVLCIHAHCTLHKVFNARFLAIPLWRGWSRLNVYSNGKYHKHKPSYGLRISRIICRNREEQQD